MSESEEEINVNDIPLVQLKRDQHDAALVTIAKLNEKLSKQEEEVDRLTRRIEQTRLVLDEVQAQWKAIYLERIRPTLRQGLVVLCLLLGISMGVSPHTIKFVVWIGFALIWWIL